MKTHVTGSEMLRVLSRDYFLLTNLSVFSQHTKESFTHFGWIENRQAENASTCVANAHDILSVRIRNISDNFARALENLNIFT